MTLLTVRDKWFRFLIILLPSMVVVSDSGLLTRLTKNALLQAIISIVAIILICEGRA